MKIVMTKQEIEEFVNMYHILTKGRKNNNDYFYDKVKHLIKEYGDIEYEDFIFTSWPDEDCVECSCTTAPPCDYPYALGEDTEDGTLTGFARFMMNYMAFVSNPWKLRNMSEEQIHRYISAGVDLTF